jgi:hypothetical protein
MLLCECGRFVGRDTFRCYIPTKRNPSTPVFGHRYCGRIFDLCDEDFPTVCSSKTELKRLAMDFAEIKRLDDWSTMSFLSEVDRLKSEHGQTPDIKILLAAFAIIKSKI